MELAKVALSSLLPKLGSLLTKEYNLQKGVRGEIRFLEDEMRSIQAALEDVAELPADQISSLNKIWMRDLKELSYDIEDSVDDFMVHVDSTAKPHSLTGLRRFIDKIGSIGKINLVIRKAKARHRIGMELEDIKTRVHDVANRRRRYLPDATMVPDKKPSIDPRVPAMFEEVSRLVGIDGPAKKLTNLLTRGDSMEKQKLMVASIVGVGGLGKTTLANSVYQQLRGQFRCQAFVSVSLKPDIHNILCSILRQISQDSCKDVGEKNLVELIQNIKDCLSDKRYLIVMDDVWDNSAWETIKFALINNDNGSRIIVTTRNHDVAKSCAAAIRHCTGMVFELEPLSDADSKRLFYGRVFKKEEVIDTMLDRVAQKILKKCGGVPLAITTIASLLASKKTKGEWDAVYRSIGSGLDKHRNMETMRVILSLSYSGLPSCLKPCLLYLSFFPEDCIIDKDSLVRRWVAEGLVDEKSGKNLYDLYERGEGYFNELVNRSFIQPLDIDLDGIARACRVHDMILDLLISLSIEDNFVVRSDYEKQLRDPLCMIRRLSLQDSQEDSNEKLATVDVSHVRSVISFGDAFKRMPPLSRFSVLRVLDLGGFPTKYNRPWDLRNLHHLRYLRLRGLLSKDVLEEIGNLQHLQMLDLSNAYIDELPSSIVRLRSLQSLLVDSGVIMPDGIGKLRLLQEISWIKVRPNTVAELGKLTELRVLCICELGSSDSEKYFVQSLSNLRNLLGLFITRSGLCSLDGLSDHGGVPSRLQFFRGTSTTFHQLPRWFSTLEKLSGLTITVNKFSQRDLEMLGKLRLLRFLQLKVTENNTTEEEELLIGNAQHFESLEELKFLHCEGCFLVFAERVMPVLQKLELYIQLRKRVGGGFKIGLENLASLKHVTVKVDCYKAKITEVEDAETMFKDAMRIHLNHPSLELSRVREWQMVEDENNANPAAALDYDSSDFLSTDGESDNDSEAPKQRKKQS